MSDYHSAMKRGHVVPHQPVEWYGSPRGSVAFRHDVIDPLPLAFRDCDVVYGDLPGSYRGLGEFNRRAGVDHDFAAFMRGVRRAVLTLGSWGIPVFLTGGSLHLRTLSPLTTVSGHLNGDRTHLLCFGALPFDVGSVDDMDDFLRRLARRFHVGGDFVCGYGRTGRRFAEAGRRFVLTDVNAECIGYIAAHCPSWESVV